MDASHVLVLTGTLAIAAQWLAWRIKWPSIVILIALGFLFGPVLDIIHPITTFGTEFYHIVELCVAVILFEGGLTLHWHELSDVFKLVKRLVMLGIPFMWLLGTFAAYFIGGIGWEVSLIFGAITVVTGPTVIMPLLRQSTLQKRPASFLKWEGIINDPFGALLAVIVLDYFLFIGESPNHITVIAKMLGSVGVGFITGWLAAKIMVYLLRRGHIPEFLKPLVLLMAVLALDVTTNMVHTNIGLLACTMFGLFLRNSDLASITTIHRFKEYITVLLVSVLFILLTANIDLQAIRTLDIRFYLLMASMLLLVRPLSIYLATIGSDINHKERTLLAYFAPRGIVAAAVAAVFAPQLYNAGIQDADKLVNLVYGLIIITVVIHGFTLNSLGRLLGLSSNIRNGILLVGASPWSIQLAKTLDEINIPVIINDLSFKKLRPARFAGINVHNGEILSEDAEASLEVGQIKYLLACTENDAYNSLVCSHFVADIGRKDLYQLPTTGENFEKADKKYHRTLRGRSLLKDKCQYSGLMQHYYDGYHFQKTKLTKSYTYEDYLSNFSNESSLILLVTEDGEIVFFMEEHETKPQAGDTIISYVPNI